MWVRAPPWALLKMAKKKLPEKDFKWTPELGYIVGLLVTDGCLSSDKRHIIMRSVDIDLLQTFKKCLNTNNRVVTKFMSASELHIKWLHKKIKDLADVKGVLLCKHKIDSNRVPIWEIKFSKKESIKLLQWIYYKVSLPCLKRKKKLATELIKKYH